MAATAAQYTATRLVSSRSPYNLMFAKELTLIVYTDMMALDMNLFLKLWD